MYKNGPLPVSAAPHSRGTEEPFHAPVRPEETLVIDRLRPYTESKTSFPETP